MWQFMESQPNVFVNSSREGIDRVSSSDYAYLMESSMLEYAVERNCELTQIGGLLDSKGYGLGLPKGEYMNIGYCLYADFKGSPYRELISTAILRLQEKTVLTDLKEKWWKKRRGGGKCSGEESKSSTAYSELGLQNVGGVFVMLVAGLCTAVLLAIVEFVLNSKKVARHDTVCVCEFDCVDNVFFLASNMRRNVARIAICNEMS